MSVAFAVGSYVGSLDNETVSLPYGAERNVEVIESIDAQMDTAMEIAAQAPSVSASVPGYIVVTDCIDNNSGSDVSDEIQQIIDNNPNRTIYFPDGIYLISKSILTPADPHKSVDLQFSNYAVIRAVYLTAGEWQTVFRLTAEEKRLSEKFQSRMPLRGFRLNTEPTAVLPMPISAM